PCQMLSPIIEKIVSEYSGKVEVQKIDVDKNPAAAQEAGVMGIPTLVLEKAGSEVDRRTGFMPEEELKKWIDGNL
ncbi:thioredoxin domain-containing protein, partial [Arthrospira platensis SPKY2]